MLRKPARIVIFGQYKTGTTALFYRIRGALPRETVTLYEATKYEASWRDFGKPVLAKVILTPHQGDERIEYSNFLAFPHRVLITRDPRDRIVSGALFLAQQSPSIYRVPENVDRVVGLLERKERDPASLSLAAILAEILHLAGETSIEELVQELRAEHQWVFDFERQLEGHCLLRYEDFVDGVTHSLERYLGFPLPADAPVEELQDHVVRTCAYGDWKNWFLPEDIARFRPVTSSYLTHFGYEDDWAPAEAPRILPEHSSGYVRRTVAKRLAGLS